MKAAYNQLLLGLALALLALPSPAKAAHYANCQLFVVVKKINGPVHMHEAILQVKASVKVARIGAQTGNDTSHCSNAKMKGKTLDVTLLAAQKTLIQLVKKDARLEVNFSFLSRSTKGVVTSKSERWYLRRLAPKPRKPGARKAKPSKARPRPSKR